MDGLLTDFAKLLLESGKPQVLNVNGTSYSSKKVFELPRLEVEALRLKSLKGFCDYIALNVDSIDVEQFFVQVLSPTKVRLMGKINEHLERAILATADFDSNLLKVDSKLNEWMPISEFIIWLQCNFASSESKRDLLKSFGNISSANVRTCTDDGVTQVITITDETKTHTAIKNPVNLRPVRSFEEIEPLENEFILRIDAKSDNIFVLLRDFAPDAWRYKYCKVIATYLQKNLPEEVIVLV